MPIYKDEKKGIWYVMTRYTDWQGVRKQKCKRGFSTKREVQNWERQFSMQSSGNTDMTFEAFLELYENDMRQRLKESTWDTKKNIIDNKILPYFKDKQMNEITNKRCYCMAERDACIPKRKTGAVFAGISQNVSQSAQRDSESCGQIL